MSPNAVIAEQRLQRCQDSFMEVAFAFAQARFGLRPRVESLQVCHFVFKRLWYASRILT